MCWKSAVNFDWFLLSRSKLKHDKWCSVWWEEVEQVAALWSLSIKFHLFASCFKSLTYVSFNSSSFLLVCLFYAFQHSASTKLNSQDVWKRDFDSHWHLMTAGWVTHAWDSISLRLWSFPLLFVSVNCRIDIFTGFIYWLLECTVIPGSVFAHLTWIGLGITWDDVQKTSSVQTPTTCTLKLFGAFKFCFVCERKLKLDVFGSSVFFERMFE
jgi:hypothetical protein